MGRCWRIVVLGLAVLHGCRTLDPLEQPVPEEPRSEVASQVNEPFRKIEKAEDIAGWVQRFETEDREIFARRTALVEALELEPGMRVADVGSGTGFFLEPFSRAVGSEGTVYAVDIVPEFLERIQRLADAGSWSNVKTVLCDERSVNLPRRSVDAVFICDTYHHFAYPRNTLASIYKALEPGGLLVVVDFIRIEGQSRPWILEHVRAGQESFQAEIEAAGFRYQDELPLLTENYVMRFRRRLD